MKLRLLFLLALLASACGGRSTLAEPEATTTSGSTTIPGPTPGLPTDSAFCLVYPPGTQALGLGVDGDRNVIVGLGNASLSLGGQTFSGSLIAKYDSTGSFLWAKSLHFAVMFDVSVEPNGSIAVSGWNDPTNGGGDPGCPSEPCFHVIKLAPDGAEVFDRALLGYQPGSLAAGPAGEIYVASRGASLGCTTVGPNGVQVGRLSSEGSCDWGTAIVSPVDGSPSQVWTESGPSGRLTVSGVFLGNVALGGKSASEAEDTNTFLAKLDAAGAPEVFRALPADIGSRFSAAPDGDWVATGGFWKGLDLGEGPGAYVPFVARLDPAGNVRWAVGVPGQLGLSVRADEGGNVIVAGISWGSFEAPSDVFLSRYDPSGALLSARRFGDAADQQVHRMVVNPRGTPILEGPFSGTLDFGFETLVAEGGLQHYVCQVPWIE